MFLTMNSPLRGSTIAITFYLFASCFHQSTSSIFTVKNEIEGNVGTGKIPQIFIPVINNLSDTYIKEIQAHTKLFPTEHFTTTQHSYFTELEGAMKTNFETITDYFHTQLSLSFATDDDDDVSQTTVSQITEMNEIYYSNLQPNYKKLNLYGASANILPHRDCILYNFNRFRVYRVILGLTDNNNDTTTEFVNLGIEKKINKGDYMIFDFDRTVHKIKKDGVGETPRILLKMHFIVYENKSEYERCLFSPPNFVKMIYIGYYYIARYTEQIGTDPTTFIGFFYGLIWEIPFVVSSFWKKEFNPNVVSTASRFRNIASPATDFVVRSLANVCFCSWFIFLFFCFL
jgi:hypothetical protein